MPRTHWSVGNGSSGRERPSPRPRGLAGRPPRYANGGVRKRGDRKLKNEAERDELAPETSCSARGFIDQLRLPDGKRVVTNGASPLTKRLARHVAVFSTAHATAAPLRPSPVSRLNTHVRSTPRLFLSFTLMLVAPLVRAHEAAAEMAAAAKTFLAALNADQQKQATYALTDAERENWNFVPIARQGLPIRSMSTQQAALGLALLRTGLSHTGMARAQAVMALELVLKELEKDTTGRRDPTGYFVTIFGEPTPDKSWGWRFEGHHLSFNFTVVDGKHVFFAPSFIGSNPAEVRAGPRKGERVLGEEEDLGLALVNALDESQRKTAIFSSQPVKEIFTTNKKRVEPLSPAGLSAADMTPRQREMLVGLVKLYLNRWRPDLANEALAKIHTAGPDQITFAWAGGLDRSHQTYYRIQGPTFLIEFDNFQGKGNHVHTTVRDFKGDFGHDLLREHYAKEHAR